MTFALKLLVAALSLTISGMAESQGGPSVRLLTEGRLGAPSIMFSEGPWPRRVDGPENWTRGTYEPVSHTIEYFSVFGTVIWVNDDGSKVLSSDSALREYYYVDASRNLKKTLKFDYEKEIGQKSLFLVHEKSGWAAYDRTLNRVNSAAATEFITQADALAWHDSSEKVAITGSGVSGYFKPVVSGGSGWVSAKDGIISIKEVGDTKCIGKIKLNLVVNKICDLIYVKPAGLSYFFAVKKVQYTSEQKVYLINVKDFSVDKLDDSFFLTGDYDGPRSLWLFEYLNRPNGEGVAKPVEKLPSPTIVFAADAISGDCTSRPLYYVQGGVKYASDALTGKMTTTIVGYIEGDKILSVVKPGDARGVPVAYLINGKIHAVDGFNREPAAIISYVENGKVYASDAMTHGKTTKVLRCIVGPERTN